MSFKQSENLRYKLKGILRSNVSITINPNKTVTVSNCGNLFSWEVAKLAFIGEQCGFGMEVRPCLYVSGNLELFFSDHYLNFKYSALQN